MSRIYVADGEDRILDESARASTGSAFVALSDGTTEYVLGGPEPGELVLCVPGITVPAGYWDRLAGHLHERGLRTLAYSAYGRGWSDRLAGPYDQALFIRQLGELTDALGIGREFHLLGTSMGGLVAIAYATATAAKPPLSLTLVGPAGLAPPQRLLERVLGLDPLARVIGRRAGRRLLFKHLSHNVGSPEDAAALAELVGDPYRFQGSIYALLATLRDYPLAAQQELYRRAGRLAIPKLLLWGELDRVTPIEQLEQVRELLAPDECHVLSACGHMVPFERPRAAADLLAGFYGRLPT